MKKLYNAKGHVAHAWPKAEIQLELYAVMLGILLGTQHPVLKAFL